MTIKTVILILIITILDSFHSQAQGMYSNFNKEKDLLLVHYDCKTDVDDLQSVAGFRTLLSDAKFSDIHYHAVAGAYGVQEGLYVPPNDLFNLAFGDHWSDAHENFQTAVSRVKKIALKTLANQGDVWIAEAGQSDFSAALIKAIQTTLPDLNSSNRIHIVQHSDWNEEVTSVASLDFVRQHIDYIKIPDGNVVGNGSPGFRTPNFTRWRTKLAEPKLIEVWTLAVDLSNKYNGKEGRYLNEAISAGGLDFSDLSEVCWILGLKDIKDTDHFFNLFTK